MLQPPLDKPRRRATERSLWWLLFDWWLFLYPIQFTTFYFWHSDVVRLAGVEQLHEVMGPSYTIGNSVTSCVDFLAK
jgi:hypothetical protein